MLDECIDPNFITPAKPIAVFLGIRMQTSLEPIILSTAGPVESRLSF